jgi:hypothetical protein
MGTAANDVRTAIVAAVNTKLKEGTGANATLKLRASNNSVLLTVNLNATNPIGSATNGVASLNAPVGESTWEGFAVTPASAGTVDHAVLCDTDGDVQHTLSVGTSSGEVRLSSLVLDTGIDVVFSTAPTCTAKAS